MVFTRGKGGNTLTIQPDNTFIQWNTRLQASQRPRPEVPLARWIHLEERIGTLSAGGVILLGSEDSYDIIKGILLRGRIYFFH